ncbi:MAG: hypothetical protein CL920_34775 [Deltaproteobacteria bacterium]|nr:hypothetical protein [Deltaproteobacteria bacterium]MBU53887.1 hypothetical protein [Deltaproteobacteria bacterium]
MRLFLRTCGLLCLFVLVACEGAPKSFQIKPPAFCKSDADCFDISKSCVGGLCQYKAKTDLCGNGFCDASETCKTCPQDCSAACGSCGDSVCDVGTGENCASCPSDCGCKLPQVCNRSKLSCEKTCGNGVCENTYNENCETCPGDCKCPAGRACTKGSCFNACGDGRCDAAENENCTSCPDDCGCPDGTQCQNGRCGAACGDGTCDDTQGENCSSCPTDCACKTSGEICANGLCQAPCGDGFCEIARKENCDTCPSDCSCPSQQYCDVVSGGCLPYCGDNQCDANRGENCSTCASDCKCNDKQACSGGSCVCVKQCAGKECGDDGCGGQCGSCSGATTCDTGTNKCECTHECTLGDGECTGGKGYRRCLLDASGCRVWQTGTCQNTCEDDGVCCDCGSKVCGSDGCGGSCGACSSKANCVSGQCQCTHECNSVGELRCSPQSNGKYEECFADASGCRYWSEKSCSGGRTCVNGQCCTPTCSGKECGSDGCGGQCGSCSSGGGTCFSGLCPRTLEIISIKVPCRHALCRDYRGNSSDKRPDVIVSVQLSNGQKFYMPTRQNMECDKEVQVNWKGVTGVDPAGLNGMSIAVLDKDGSSSATVCASWWRDFSGYTSETTFSNNFIDIKLKVTK